MLVLCSFDSKYITSKEVQYTPHQYMGTARGVQKYASYEGCLPDLEPCPVMAVL